MTSSKRIKKTHFVRKDFDKQHFQTNYRGKNIFSISSLFKKMSVKSSTRDTLAPIVFFRKKSIRGEWDDKISGLNDFEPEYSKE